MKSRSVSVVISTYNRAKSLALTLASLEWLDHPSFEVIVVNGPSTDGTDDLLSTYEGRIKVARCPNRNLSESRNLGVRSARGEIVAFLDDDAYPDPAWLSRLTDAYQWDEVAAAGGPVFNYTGYAYQVFHSRSDRFGNSWSDYPPCVNPTPLLSAPQSNQFTYTIGTNSSFRRDRLVAIGGFDEEFEYYLDETDVCCRLTDAGWVVAALDDGYVYHKFLPSDIRDRRDVIRDWFQVMKSRFYFGMKHGYPMTSFADVCAEQSKFVEEIRGNVALNVEAGVHEPEVATKFESDVREASNVALRRYLSGASRERPPAWFDEEGDPLLLFPTRLAEEQKLHLCFLSQEYPPDPVNGIGRVIHSLARGLAARGHVVRVLTRGGSHNRVDLEDGVWVHRIVDHLHHAPAGIDVPLHIWHHAASLFDELVRIDGIRPIDVVQAPNWDSEGIAAVLDRRFRVIVGLYTPLKTVIRVDPGMQQSIDRGEAVLGQLVGLERHVYSHADGFLACGPGIVKEVESQYDVALPEERVGLVAHGLPDMAAGLEPPSADGTPGEPPAGAAPRLFFVGRLEARKGIDILLATVPKLIDLGLDFTVTVVGDDSLVSASGTTFRQAFEEERPDLHSRVEFLGRVDDIELRRLYAASDVFVAPSRFESFGLMLLEAMMFEKPVVCTRVGGMSEIVVNARTGLLVEPDSVESLASALAHLIRNPEVRNDLGRRGRQLYEERFSDTAMASGAERFYRMLLDADADADADAEAEADADATPLTDAV